MDEAALADEHVPHPLPLLQAQVREVGRLWINRQIATSAVPLGQGGDAGHLVNQGRDVLWLGLGHLITQIDEGVVEVRGSGGPAAVLGEGGSHPCVDLQFLMDDPVGFGLWFDAIRLHDNQTD